MARGAWRRFRFLSLAATAALVFEAGFVTPVVAIQAPAAPGAVAVPAIEAPEPTPAPTGTPTPAPTEAPSQDPAPSPTTSPTIAPEPAAPVPAEPAPPADDGTIGLLPPLPAGATELVAARTETSRTYRDASGRLTGELYTNPVFHRPGGDGALVPVRLGFLPSADGETATSDQAPLAVAVAPASDPSGFLAVTIGEHVIAYRPLDPKALPATASADPRSTDGRPTCTT